MLVEVTTTEERIGVHLTCQIKDAHESIAKCLSTLPGCFPCYAGPSERGVQMEIREMNDSHGQQLEFAVHGIHMRVSPDIVGASVPVKVESATRKDFIFATSHRRQPERPA